MFSQVFFKHIEKRSVEYSEAKKRMFLLCFFNTNENRNIFSLGV